MAEPPALVAITLGDATTIELEWREGSDDPDEPGAPRDLAGHEVELWDLDPRLAGHLVAAKGGAPGVILLTYDGDRGVPRDEALVVRVASHLTGDPAAQRRSLPAIWLVLG